MIAEMDDADRPWSTPLPRDEAPTLQSVDHLIHGGCRNEKVAPDVRFRWGNTEPEDVPRDELKVFALTASGLRAVVEAFRSRVARTASQGHGEALLKPFDGEDGLIGEVNFESLNVRLRNMRYRLAGHAVGDVRNVDARPSHCDHPLRFPRGLRPNDSTHRRLPAARCSAVFANVIRGVIHIRMSRCTREMPLVSAQSLAAD